MSARFVLLGHPVGHSVSPAIHRRAYELLGVSASYELRDAPSEADVARAVHEIRDGVLTGANVTVPHKHLALRLADRMDASARSAGVANVLARDAQGQVVAYNTDVLGLADELRSEALASVELRHGRTGALVVGSGGAARAAVLACKEAGFAPLFVTARRFVGEGFSDEGFSPLGATAIGWPAGAHPGAAVANQVGFIVQATSAGMKGVGGGDELTQAVGLRHFEPSVVYDLVYNPRRTPLLVAAEASGHRVASGLGMLVGQAARAIEIWLGKRPESAPLLEAAREALGS